MHELGLCASIVDAITERAGDRRVARVTVQVGRLLHVHPEAFDQSFAVAAQGTVAQDADARLVLLPVTGQCRACGHTWESDELMLACTACGSVEIDVRGDDLVLEAIEYEP
jgi:hydrogenase nickel incorporation protein HypA/HybF